MRLIAVPEKPYKLLVLVHNNLVVLWKSLVRHLTSYHLWYLYPCSALYKPSDFLHN